MRVRSIVVEFLVVASTAFLSGAAVTAAWSLAAEGYPKVNWALMVALAVGIGTSVTWTTACQRPTGNR